MMKCYFKSIFLLSILGENVEYQDRNIQLLYGQRVEILLNLCNRVKEKFQLSWRMISLVSVVLTNSKQNEEAAFTRIEEAFREVRSRTEARVPNLALQCSYRTIPYPSLYTSAALYQPWFLPPNFCNYPSSTLLTAAPTVCSPSSPRSPTANSPLAYSTPLRPESRT